MGPTNLSIKRCKSIYTGDGIPGETVGRMDAACKPPGTGSRCVSEGIASPKSVNTFRGIGSAYSHHGELLQGVFRDQQGKLCHGLVTMPIQQRGAEVSFSYDRFLSQLAVFPKHKTKALTAAQLTLDYFGLSHSGQLYIDTYVAEGAGLGSSTADVVATCYAIANAFNLPISEQQVAKIAVMAECASDPLMFRKGVMFYAQREGRVIEVLGDRLPSFGLISFSLGEPVATCCYSPKYSGSDIDDFSYLLSLLRQAVDSADVRLLGKVGMLSAKINQRFLPKPYFDDILDIVEINQLPGLQIAHSGNRVGLLFSAEDSDKAERIIDTKNRLLRLGIRHVDIVNDVLNA